MLKKFVIFVIYLKLCQSVQTNSMDDRIIFPNSGNSESSEETKQNRNNMNTQPQYRENENNFANERIINYEREYIEDRDERRRHNEEFRRRESNPEHRHNRENESGERKRNPNVDDYNGERGERRRHDERDERGRHDEESRRTELNPEHRRNPNFDNHNGEEGERRRHDERNERKRNDEEFRRRDYNGEESERRRHDERDDRRRQDEEFRRREFNSEDRRNKERTSNFNEYNGEESERIRAREGDERRRHNEEFRRPNHQQHNENNERDQNVDEYFSEETKIQSIRSPNGPPKPPPKPPNGNANNKQQKQTRLCEQKFMEYMNRIFHDEDTVADGSDSDFNGRTLATPGEYPHMTAVGFLASNNDIDYKCGGSLISETFVVTAAHCINITGQKPTKVRIGDLNLMVEERYLEPQVRNIKKIHTHPDYKSDLYYNDIALLEIDKEVEFTEFVRPIRLWIENDLAPNTIAYAMGYGATTFGKAQTNRLTDLNLTVVSNTDCNNQMPEIPETPSGIISSQICAKDYLMNRDTCQGDSGGPLQLNLHGRRRRDRKHYHLIGITSYGLVCRSSYPSVYTRVSSFLDWIENVIWSAIK